MRRREILAGLGGLGVLSAGGAYQADLLDSERFGNQERTDIDPVDLPRLEAPGSSEGMETVPEEGRVTFLSVFATWCTICQAEMPTLGDAAEELDDVQFLSLTYELVDEEDIVDWWHEYDGSWPVVHDEDMQLMRQFDDATGVPYSAVIDADNRLVWDGLGEKSTEEIVTTVEEYL